MDNVDNVLDDVVDQDEYVVDDVDKEEEERRERRSVELQELRLRMTRQREISMVDTRWEAFFGNNFVGQFLSSADMQFHHWEAGGGS